MKTQLILHWHFVSHLAETGQHIVALRCEEYPNVHCEQVTRYNRRGEPTGPTRTYYFIEGDRREFQRIPDLLGALGLPELL